MSQENVEIVPNYVKVWSAGDMEGVRELYDPDAVMEVAPGRPESGHARRAPTKVGGRHRTGRQDPHGSARAPTRSSRW